MVTGFTFLSRLTQIAPPSTRFVFLGAGYASGFPPTPPHDDEVASGSELAPPLPPGTFTPNRSPMPGVHKSDAERHPKDATAGSALTVIFARRHDTRREEDGPTAAGAAIWVRTAVPAISGIFPTFDH